MNNPKVVFLDEMTTGLDPAERRTAWELIRTIRDRGATVILVTHFMDEAEQLCDRLAVFNQGKIAAINSPQGLINKYAQLVRISFTTDSDTAFLEELPFVEKVNRKGSKTEIEGPGNILAPLIITLRDHDITPEDISVKQPSLEDVFLAITGSHVQD